MKLGLARAEGADLVQVVVAGVAVVLFGGWFLVAAISGEVFAGFDSHLRTVVVRSTDDPARYNGAVGVIGVLGLVGLGRTISLVRDMFAPASERVERKAGVAGDPRPYFQFALMAFIMFCLVVGAGYVDSLDGVTRLSSRSGLAREADDPAAFRGALILKYGLYATLSLIALVAGAVGGLAVQHANQSARK